MTRSDSLYESHPRLWRRLLAMVYGAAVAGRGQLQRLGLLKTRRLPVRVICVGNLTVGGTGKTPTAIWIARRLRARGRRPAVISRGYRGRDQEPVNIVSDGREILLGPSRAGDEPYLMARSLPGIPVLTGRDRWAVGWHAVERLGADVLVLDDGFQHTGLEREVNLLLLDAAKPWGNGFLLPAGPLREPVREARRATAFVLTRVEGDCSDLIGKLSETFPNRPVFRARHRPVVLKRLDGAEERDPGFLAGRRVLAFCGLARPMVFLKSLMNLRAEVPCFIRWPDHYRPSETDLRMIESKAGEAGVTEAVTTAKDAVKLAGRELGDDPDRLRVWVLEMDIEILDGEEALLEHIWPEAGNK